jgi:hypothetical protein
LKEKELVKPQNSDQSQETLPNKVNENISSDSTQNLGRNGDTDEENQTLLDETSNSNDDKVTKEKFLNEFYYAIQFCFQCYKGKKSPVLHT